MPARRISCCRGSGRVGRVGVRKTNAEKDSRKFFLFAENGVETELSAREVVSSRARISAIIREFPFNEIGDPSLTQRAKYSAELRLPSLSLFFLK